LPRRPDRRLGGAAAMRPPKPSRSDRRRSVDLGQERLPWAQRHLRMVDDDTHLRGARFEVDHVAPA
jgi:hypothetical protein